MRTLSQDLRYAVRLLRRAPGFAAVAIATLAIGIGATTTIFTIVDSVLLRPLPFAESQRLTMLRPSSGSRLSAAYLHDWRVESRTFQDLAGWYDVRVNLTGRGEPLEVRADRVTPNFFALLGTPAVLGRAFTAGRDLSDVAPEVVLSHGAWQRRFGADPGVIGRTITLDGDSFTVVGVMPEEFAVRTTELAESRAELWMPFRLVPEDRVGMGGFLNVIGRLAPGVTVEQAQTELALIAQRIEEAFPSYSREWRIAVVPLRDATVRDVRLMLLVLFGAVAILLLIVCANIANLVLSRAAGRETETAIRFSLGATSGRLMRQFLTENLVLAAIGGGIGVAIAMWATAFLVSVLPAGLDLPRTREIAVDLRVLMFATVVTTFTASVFGLVPFISSARSRHAALRNVARGSSTAPGRHRIGDALVVSEVALAVILLAGAALLARSFWELTRVQPGFNAEHVLTMRTTLPAAKYDTDDRLRFFGRALLERIGDMPGVQAVGFADYLPMSRFGAAAGFEIDGRTVTRFDEPYGSWVSVVGGHYFDAMAIPLLRGRLPNERDSEQTQPVFVIDEALARRYWPNDDPLGSRVTWSKSAGERLSGEIVGIVGSVRWRGMAAAPNPTAYFWFPQDPGREFAIVARAVDDPAAIASLVSAVVREIDPDQPVADIRPLRDFVSADLAQSRFTMQLLSGFAGAALILAAIGLYGVIALGVARRTREIGIRVALGAKHRDVLQLVMGRGMLLIGVGLAIGIAAALALGRLVAGLLFGVTPSDPATLAAVVLFLAALAMFATYVPARRALRIQPNESLRAE